MFQDKKISFQVAVWQDCYPFCFKMYKYVAGMYIVT